MAKVPMTTRLHRQRLHALYGGVTPSSVAVRRATASRQKAFDAAFKRQQTLRAEHDARMAAIHAPVLEAYRLDPTARRSVKQLRDLSATWRSRKLVPPRVLAHEPRIVADLGATVVPPYDFQEVLFSSTGNPPNASSARKSTGSITSSIGFNFTNPSSASVTASVGIFFRPVISCPGTLKISTNIGLRFDWSTFCAFSSAHSDGWLGLAVEQFDSNNFSTGMLVDLKIFLWSDDSWWGGAGSHDGSNSAFPLFAQCPVDSQHSYHIWVRCGGTVSSSGWGGWFGSAAGSRIFGTVPSIAWELV